MDNTYIIAEFNDGLQLIPALWYNADTNSSIWSGHFKSKFRVNKAIVAREIPKNKLDWEELPIKKIFGKAGSYEEGIEKLVLAEDTSNIDDISSTELQEYKKKKRHLRAKKQISSSSDEDTYLSEKENNNVRQTSDKVLPPFPPIEEYISCNNKMHILKSIRDNSSDVLVSHERSTPCTVSGKNRTINTEVFTKNIRQNITEEPNGDNDKENSFTREYKQLVVGKLNKVIYKLNNIENRMEMLENKMQPCNSFGQEEILIHLPISTFPELTSFEEQLQEANFKNEVVHTFKVIGGSTAHIMIRNILKKSITNNFAQNFSWAGKKKKKSFEDLGLAKIITQAVRCTFNNITETDVATTISKWLAQATVRIERKK